MSKRYIVSVILSPQHKKYCELPGYPHSFLPVVKISATKSFRTFTYTPEMLQLLGFFYKKDMFYLEFTYPVSKISVKPEYINKDELWIDFMKKKLPFCKDIQDMIASYIEIERKSLWKVIEIKKNITYIPSLFVGYYSFKVDNINDMQFRSKNIRFGYFSEGKLIKEYDEDIDIHARFLGGVYYLDHCDNKLSSLEKKGKDLVILKEYICYLPTSICDTMYERYEEEYEEEYGNMENGENIEKNESIFGTTLAGDTDATW